MDKNLRLTRNGTLGTRIHCGNEEPGVKIVKQ